MRTKSGAFAGAAAVLLLACGTQNWSFDGDAGTGADTSAPSCSMDSDCQLATLHCDVASGQCVACVDDGQCTQPGHPRCDSALHECVQCGVTGDCAPGQLCEPTSHRCLPSCADSGACPASAPQCDASRGVCVGCSSNTDCVSSSTGHVCDPASGQCVQCTADTQCAAPTPRCNRADDQCVRCLTGKDCGEEGVCNPTTHTCTGDHDE